MSIIYDALKKSQQARAAKPTLTIARKAKNIRVNRKDMILTLLILTCLFATAVIVTMPAESALKLPILGQKMAGKKPAPLVLRINAAPRLMLDGVFLSDKEKLAMINRRSYHEGDVIGGFKVVSIAFDQVRLKDQTRSITLRNAITQLN